MTTSHMKKLSYIILMLFISMNIAAQSSDVKKAAKSVFTLTTFNENGDIISSSQGVFIDNQGTAICTFKPFVGAARATIIDTSGKSYDVDAILGADELYDVAKVRVKTSSTAATIATAAERQGSQVWLVPYAIKNPTISKLSISSVEQFNSKYNYYILNGEVPENAEGGPVLNDKGQVIGIMHKSSTHTTAVDVNYIRQLTVTGLSSLDASLKETSIRTALPDNENEAITMMTFKKTSSTEETYQAYVDEFIEKFPTSSYGYRELALIQTDKDLFDQAAKTMEKSISKATKKDESHSDYGNLIYQKMIYKSDKPYEPWTLDKALEETKKAYEINPQPGYQHQEAQIIYSQGKYQEAYDLFMSLTKTPINNAEIYYEAAQSKMQLQAPDTEIMELLDSAVSLGKRTGMAAPYILARGEYLFDKGEYRKALSDYNAYDTLTTAVNDAFFYKRYKCEMQVRQWQQALLDIARACYLNPKEPTYFAEWAALDIRVKRYNEAISAATHCTELAPDYADGYLLLGLAQIENGLKADGIKNLEKAKELGDPRADEYLQKNK